MTFLIMRAVLDLRVGDRLLYDCPVRGDSHGAERFFEQYRGKYAAFVGYCEKLIGPLDFKGRVPGRYLNPKGIKVKFDDEQEVHELNFIHFVLRHPREHRFLPDTFDFENQRLGDLACPVEYYKGDMVRFKNSQRFDGDTHEVVEDYLEPPFNAGPMPHYAIYESERQRLQRLADSTLRSEFERMDAKRRRQVNVSGEDIELVSRGNVWALYNDPAKLSFASDEEEAAFWAQNGISEGLHGGDMEFLKLAADIIERSAAGRMPVFHPRRLFPCWDAHRERVRALNARLEMMGYFAQTLKSEAQSA